MYSRCYATIVRSEYTAAVLGQRLAKHVPAETNMHTTIALLWKQDIFDVIRAEML
jgi:hypothetical protein